ncbi:MAG: response regulator transcription factor [Chloroflexota bacterium]|nr:response regulator transcription factor [Chloroflexota bacterium]
MHPHPLTVILIDDQSATHRLVADLLNTVEDIRLVGQGASGSDVLLLYEQHRPNVVLMDVMMPGVNGIAATQALMRLHPDARILVLSGFQDDDSIHAMLDSGASGYVLKISLMQDLINGIRAAANGAALLSSPVARSVLHRVPAPQNTYGLTDREREVLRLIAGGASNKQVADMLMISISTVKFHLNNVLEKMGVDTRSEAIVLAVKESLL